MAKSKEQKKEILARTESSIKDSASTVFVHFTGVSVGEEIEMRRTLKEHGLNYFVAKKTLIKRAFDSLSIKGDAPELEGEIAIAYGTDDPTAPAREIYTFVKKHKDKISIVGGIYEGSFKDQEGMNEIATIPPIEVLRGMFVNVINSPIAGFVRALDQIAQAKEN